MKKLIQVLFAIAVLAPNPLAAISVRMSTSIPQVTLNPDARSWSTGTLRVTSGGYIGTFTVVIHAQSIIPLPSPDPIHYGIWTNPSNSATALGIDAAPQSSTEVLSGSFPKGSASNARVSFSLSAVIDAGSLPVPGTYQVSLRADVYTSGFPVSGSSAANTSFQVSIRVTTRFDLAVLARGGGFSTTTTAQNLDLGELRFPVTRGIDLVARSNVGWSLSLSSAKGWALASLTPASTATVPYSLRADGVALSPTAGMALSLAQGASASGIAGHRIELDFRAEPGSLLPEEGLYAEILTVTITAP